VLSIESSEPESQPNDDTSDEDDFFGPNFLGTTGPLAAVYQEIGPTNISVNGTL
jgi:hypothetical protein